MHLISIAMLQFNIPRQPNLETIYASLASSHQIFAHPHAHDSILTGLRICPADSVLVVTGKTTLSLLQKPEHSALGNRVSQSQYWALVSEGGEEIKRNVSAVLNSTAFSRKVLDVSGGRDSRLVLGAAVATRTISKCAARTVRGPSQGDLEIGVGISRLFGVPFDSAGVHGRYSKSSRFAVSFWRSMNAGASHNFGGNNWPTMWQGAGCVRLNGGCGELYRNFWLETKLLQKISSPERFRALCRPDLPSTVLPKAFDSLWSALSSMPGRTVEEKIRNHYLFFRNRFHFGLPAFNEWYGNVPFSPLQSAALLAASRLLDPSSCAGGRANFDVMEYVLPLLNRLPFAHGAGWPADLVARSRPPDALHVQLPQYVGKNREAHELSESARKRWLALNSSKVDAPEAPGSIYRTLYAEASSVLQWMRKNGAHMDVVFDASFVSWFSDLCRRSAPDAARTASKILAVYDLCFDRQSVALDLAGLPFREAYSQAVFASVFVLDGYRIT
jgi:hypothetical protein